MDKENQITFRQIVEDNKDRVYNAALGFLQNTADAEDVSQEVFIEVYRSLGNFAGNSALSTWIYRITVNKCLDFLRRKKSRRRLGVFSGLFGNEGEQLHDQQHFDHPGILLENKEKSKMLFAAIEQLSENQKTAFILFHLEDLPQKEIAVIMDISPKAVESLIQRAKAGLREKLEKFYRQRGI